MKNRALQVLSTLVLMTILSSSVFAQHELITNGEFTSGNTGFVTQYHHKPSGDVSQGEYCIDNNCQGHNNLGLGWPSVPGISGKYMIVNGEGWSSAPNKVVWKQTVNVTSQTTYDFSCQLVNLSRSIFGFNASPSVIRIKFNGSTSGYNDVTLNVANHNWQQVSRTWNSGNNSGPIDIVIYDVYNDDPDHGDDFGLDQISFIPRVWYDVNSMDDYVDNTLCMSDFVVIDILGNDNVLPNTNDAQIQILSDPIPYGTVEILPDKKIRYTFTDANYHGEVQFEYRVTNHGVQSQATVHINTAQPPTIGNINLSSPITVCAGESLTLPTPAVDANGSTIIHQGWQVKNNGIWQNVNGNNLPSISNDYSSIRYTAENQCDEVYSDEIQLVVNDEPTIGSINDIIPASLCAPTPFSYDPPTIVNNGSDPIGQGWQIQINGQWTSVPTTIEYQHNGCNVRYYVQNDCGTSYSNVAQLTVNADPVVGSITAPAGICAGESFVLNNPQVTWRHNDPSTCWGSWEIQIDGVWDSLANNNIPFEYNGCLIRYKAVNGCGTAYSTNSVQITVYSTAPVYEGEITACDVIYHHGTPCNASGMYTIDSITPEGCEIQVSWHFTMGDVNLMPPEVRTECGSYYWPKTGQTYYESVVVHDTVYSTDPQVCDSIFTLDLTINNAPTIQGGIQAQDICAGELLTLIEPVYEYNHNGGGSHQWEYATSPNGPFHAFDPETYQFELGRYYIRFAVSNSCDSVFSNVISLNVNGRPVIIGQLEPLQVCEDNPLDLPEVTVEWNNATQSGFSGWQMSEQQIGPYTSFNPNNQIQMGQNGYWVRYIASNECDTVYLDPVPITVVAEQEEWVEHSGCDTVRYAGSIYTEDQVIDEMVNDPCPHTIHHRIVVNHSDRPENNPTLIEEYTSCHDEFEWHGHIYYRTDGAQTDRWITENTSGCDSIRELRLDFGDYASKTDYYMECDSFTWSRNNMTYRFDEGNTQVLDTFFIPGDDVVCDSIIYLNLTLGASYYEVVGDPIPPQCSGFEWHGVYYYEDAVVYDSLQTLGTHCDSIVSHQLTIIQPFDTLVEMVSCKPVWWQGHQFVEEETYTATLESTVTGCDSIVTMHFVLADVLPPFEFDTTSCSPITWYGNECIYDGMTCSHTFEFPDRCDSTVIMHFHLLSPTNNVQFISKCDTATVGGVFYELPEGEISHSYRLVLDTLVAQNGCDSIMIINLTLKDSQSIGQISGSSHVIVASSLFSGIYQYEIDTASINGSVSWSLSNPDWQVLDQDDVSCRIIVTTPGHARLIAHFNADCGEIERVFEINAGFFDVDEQEAVEVNVYPNPTNGIITIEAEGIESIRLTNMMGQVLDWKEYNRSDHAVLNMDGYSPSMYLLEIKTVNGMVKRKVALNR